MRRAFGFTLIGLLGLSVQIVACAEGTGLPSSDGGNAGSGNEGGGATGGGGSGGAGGDGCKAEVCDGLDNDCDGMTDEGCECIPGQTESCYSGAAETRDVGVCKAGTRTCILETSTFGPCDGEVLPAAETCNALDDDCNGMTDENIPDIMCGVGACMMVVSGCVNGTPETCVPGQPSSEICDGLDNDCDQLLDESFPENGQMCDTGMPGVCAPGTTQCDMGALSCKQMNMPGMEVCDGIDNDCSGTVDDNVPGTGIACPTGLMGVCADGLTGCQNAMAGCFPVVPASAEICDGLDNDCNGMTDENNPGAGPCDTGLMGICGLGMQTCMAGMLMCYQNQQAQPEACNGLDDDCNGQADDGDPGAGQPCSCGGTASCTGGKTVCQGCTTEFICNNGVTDDMDANADCQDADCALGCLASVGPCAAGETLLVLTASDLPKPIPDPGNVTSTINILETLTVKRVVLRLDITHTWTRDLRLELTSPSNTTVTLSNRNPATGTMIQNYTGTIFNSGCATPITMGTPPFNGCYAPQQPLTALINQPVKGAWTLRAVDVAAISGGTLNSWTLAICAQ